ncbi:MAG TPA: protein-L-isoaspartate(D-aspartate) O-methyltransferase [Pirellulales bacterium]|nr:protein-L-isoaspartate(D-aspartate) O-methyltransferase [Pirellulales bacterium]
MAVLVVGPAVCRGQIQASWDKQRAMMVESEIATAGIKQPAILAVMRSTPRHEFVPAEVRQYAYYDLALPIGAHQTISPPYIVAWMTTQLDPRPRDKVLEIGTGSGYQAAVLGGLASEVYTIEIEKTLAQRAGAAFQRLGYKNITLKIGDGFQGWPEHAPFDKIILTCSPEKIPQPLVAQLREGGRLVAPVGERFQQTLYVMEKRDGRLVTKSREPTFFVPMTGQAESLRVDRSTGPMTALVNGDFEELLNADQPAGWYYVRQATVDDRGPTPDAKHCLTFVNRIAGQNSQALQAIGVDGHQVSELVISLWVQAEGVKNGPTTDERARLLVSFFDENRSPVGQQSVGPWTGSFAWARRGARIKVPSEARVAIVALGLLGATGQLACDQIEIRPAGGRVAKK